VKDVDSRPLKLRADDLRDDSQVVAIELAEHMRMLLADALVLRTVITRDFQADPERALRRATSRVVELCEAVGRADDTRERLSRSLRAAGRL
jgi:hypothetical protein